MIVSYSGVQYSNRSLNGGHFFNKIKVPTISTFMLVKISTIFYNIKVN